ncbi:MAG TPA: HAD family hydrolase [Candidatus Eisenbacteria bacterium]|jgi:histidinol-phosphate phosphatase family protein
MRILVVASRAEQGARIRRAALGLERRGHAVSWWGSPAGGATGSPVLTRLRELWPLRVDVVVGDGGTVWRAGWAGWQAQSRCLVLDVGLDQVRRWSPLDRWAWHCSQSYGLVDLDGVAALRDEALGLDPERLALWPDGATAAPEIAHPDTEILERACQRALARHRGRALRPAVLVDRDGTLAREVGYLVEPSNLELLPGVPEALRRLASAGFAIVVISNQSAVGRGLLPLARVYEAMARLRILLRVDQVELDAVYFCPHRPEEDCPCRKPRTALLERAAQDLQLALSESVMIGDKLLDVAAGHGVGARGILVRSGYGADEERRLVATPAAGLGNGATSAEPLDQPDAICDDLPQVATWVLGGGSAA